MKLTGLTITKPFAIMITLLLSILFSYGFFKILVYYLERKGKRYKSGPFYLAIIFFLIIFIGSSSFGFKQPGMIFERSNYQNYVDLTVKYDGEEVIVGGRIERGVNTTMRGDTYSYYIIHEMTTPSGRKISFFDDYIMEYEEVELGRYTVIKDNRGNEWEVKLNPEIPYIWNFD